LIGTSLRRAAAILALLTSAAIPTRAQESVSAGIDPRFAAPDLPAPNLVLPWGPTIPILACLVTLGLAASAGARNLIAAGVALAVGLVLFAMRRPRSL